MTSLKAFPNSPLFFWALLALPSVGMINGALSGRDLESLLHPTGEFAARFMILAMMLTPLRMMFPGAAWVRWLMARRRYLGVAAFGYAALHTLYYVIDLGTFDAVVADFTKLGIWTGWVAFLIFVPLALTSCRWRLSKRIAFGSCGLAQRQARPAPREPDPRFWQAHCPMRTQNSRLA